MRTIALIAVLAASTPAYAKKPPRAAALAVAKQFAEALRSPDDDTAKTVALPISKSFEFVVGYEPEGGAGFCSGTIDGDPAMTEWPRACLAKIGVDIAADDGQWSDWSAKDMKKWTWQIDDSGIAKVAKRARVFVLRVPEAIWVIAVAADDDGTLRVAGAWAGMTYDAE